MTSEIRFRLSINQRGPYLTEVGYRWLTHPRRAGEDGNLRSQEELSCAQTLMTDHAFSTLSVENYRTGQTKWPTCVRWGRGVPFITLIGIIGAILLPLMACGEEPAELPGKRVAWTTSRLVGSPEPPLEFTVEKTFKNLPLRTPVYVVEEPGSDHLLVVIASTDATQPSQIVRFNNDPAVDVLEVYFELPGRLLYSLVFHPNFAENRYVYLFSNGPIGDERRRNRVSRFSVPSGEHRIDPASELVLLEWRSMGHDGGDMLFGLDSMLYITTGDATSDSDPWNSGQALDDLLGSVLRIDVDHPSENSPYSVPADNPFVNTPDARGEIWAYGLRNPWRMSLDRPSGQLWVGNNGQDLWETAHLVHRGENYGWSVYEGSHPFYPGRKRGPTPLVAPTIEHHHADFRSLTGGVVYRGRQLPELDGVYIYGDFASGRIWGMKHDGERPLWHRELADTQLAITAFYSTRAGELLVVDHGGALYRLVRTSSVTAPVEPFPRRLSETGLFESVAEQRAAAGVIPYDVNVPGWNDGAQGQRFMAVPGDEQINYDSGRSWSFPDGTALVQTLSISAARRIETRILLRQQGEWAGFSYRWNDQQDDAELVPAGGAEAAFELAAASGERPTPRTWRFPSRSECLACHSRAASFVLGLTEAQLNRDVDGPTGRENQLQSLARLGLFSSGLPKPPAEMSRLIDPHDGSQDLEARVRSYLHVNCSVCHVANGGGNALMELGISTPRDQMRLVGARPQHDTFGLDNAMLVAPGAPDRSVLVERLSRRGRGQMPPLVSHLADHATVQLVRAWIRTLEPSRRFVRDWQLEELTPALSQLGATSSTQSGRTIFRDIGCADCHRVAGEGGIAGPDLSGIAKRLTPGQLLESIVVPSKTIADEYAETLVATHDGRILSGRIDREDDRELVLRPTAAGEDLVRIDKQNISERHKSGNSTMPQGTLSVLKQEEILDLLRYLLASEAGGDPRFVD